MARYVSFRDFDWILLASCSSSVAWAVMEIHRYSATCKPTANPHLDQAGGTSAPSVVIDKVVTNPGPLGPRVPMASVSLQLIDAAQDNSRVSNLTDPRGVAPVHFSPASSTGVSPLGTNFFDLLTRWVMSISMTWSWSPNERWRRPEPPGQRWL